MRMLRTTQALPQETLLIERRTGVSGTGFPVYAAAQASKANVIEYDSVGQASGREFRPDNEGSEDKVTCTFYFRGDETVLPNKGDRITRVSGTKFIVLEHHAVSGLRFLAGEPDHYRTRCRDE